MAKRPIRPARGERPVKATSRKTVTTEVEVVEEESSGGFESGMAIATAVALLVAILLTDALLGKFDKGLFF